MRYPFVLLIAAISLPFLTHAQISVGPTAGLQLTGYRQSTNGHYSKNPYASRVVDIRAGAAADIPLKNRLHLQTGALFTSNGFYQELPNFPPSSFTINAIEIPAFLSYHLGMKYQTHFFFSGGIYADINIGGSGTTTYVDLYGNVIGTKREQLTFGSKIPADARGMSAGAGLNAGLQLKRGFFARIHYQYGLTNLLPSPIDAAMRTASNNYGLSVGYLFNTHWPKERKDKKEKK